MKENVWPRGGFVPLPFSNNNFGPPFSCDIRNSHFSVEIFMVANYLSKTGIMHFEAQDLSQDPRAGNAGMVHREDWSHEPWTRRSSASVWDQQILDRHSRLRFFFPGIKWDGLALTQGTHQPRFGVVAGCVVALGVPNKLPGPMTSAVLWAQGLKIRHRKWCLCS